MRYSYFVLVLVLAMAVVAPPVSAEAEPDGLLAAALHAGWSFGGQGGLRESRVGLQLHAAGAAHRSSAPALLQFEMRPGNALLTVAGQPLHSFGGATAEALAEGNERPSRAGSALAIGVLGTAAVLGMVSLLADRAFAEVVEEGEYFATWGASEDSEPPPCDGVKVGDECVLGG